MDDHMVVEDNIVFYGAGVSLNSGLPIVNSIFVDGKLVVEGLVDSILDNICSQEDKKTIKDSGLPFEGFIEALMSTGEIDPILDIFELGEPHYFHKTMAQLAKLGKVKTFVTTNFDGHLESSMDDLDMIRGVDYKVIAVEPTTEFVSSQLDSVVIYKLHGDIKSRDSLGITLSRVSSRLNQQKILDFFDFLNTSSSSKKIRFFGYSCSDIFDISPAIDKLGNDSKNTLSVEFLDHASGVDMEKIQISHITNKSPFQSWSGKRLAVDTDCYLASLCDRYKLIHKEEIPYISSWKDNVSVWATNTKPLHSLTVANLFFRISQYFLSEKYLLSFLSSYKTDLAIVAQAYVHLSNARSVLLNFDGAIEAAKIAKKYAYSCGEVNIAAHAEGALGIAYSNMQNFQSALESLKVSLSVEVLNKDLTNDYFNNNRAIILANMASCYIGVGDHENYLECAEKAKATAEELGDNDALLLCCRNSSKKSVLNGDYEGAAAILLEAYNLAIKVASSHFAAVVQLDLGDLYCKLNENVNAKYAYQEAIRHFELNENKIGIGLAKGNLGLVCCQEGDVNLAIKYFEDAVMLVNDSNKANYYTAWGRVLFEQGDSNQCIKYHLKAIELAANNKESQYNTKNSLGQVYLDLNSYELSKNILREALDIAEHLGNKVYVAQSSRWMALALWCLRNDDESVHYAKASYDIFYELFGDGHAKTQGALDILKKVLG